MSSRNRNRKVPFAVIGTLPPIPRSFIEFILFSLPIKSDLQPDNVADVQVSMPIGTESESKVDVYADGLAQIVNRVYI